MRPAVDSERGQTQPARMKRMTSLWLIGMLAIPLLARADGLADLQARAAQGEAGAQCDLGWKYFNGDGVAKDLKAAAGWCQKAADQGFPLAENRLGLMYEQGLGVPKSATTALGLYQKAAEHGVAAAQYNLGRAYNTGEIVPRDQTVARKWYLMAAYQGHPASQYLVGWMYQYGEGVEQSETEALAWMTISASSGNKKAAGARDTLLAKLEPGAKQAAQTRVQEILAKIAAAKAAAAN